MKKGKGKKRDKEAFEKGQGEIKLLEKRTEADQIELIYVDQSGCAFSAECGLCVARKRQAN